MLDAGGVYAELRGTLPQLLDRRKLCGRGGADGGSRRGSRRGSHWFLRGTSIANFSLSGTTALPTTFVLAMVVVVVVLMVLVVERRRVLRAVVMRAVRPMVVVAVFVLAVVLVLVLVLLSKVTFDRSWRPSLRQC